MEKHFPPNFFGATDKQQHSQNQCLYELFSFKPQRNSLCFSDYYDSNIVIPQINDKINFLKTIGFKFDEICEIKCTEYTWSLKYFGTFNKDNINILIEDDTLSYLLINNIKYKNSYMIDKIGDEFIKYNPMSFRQTDNNIKFKVYDILKKEISSTKLYLIGGEMVFFAKLLKSDEFVMYTDFESIQNDGVINFPRKKEINLVGYTNCDLQIVDKDYHLIANTSKHGLEKHLCKQILKLGLKNIVIISCNKKSFISDYNILNKKYKIDKIFDINTNYSVCIYFMKLK